MERIVGVVFSGFAVRLYAGLMGLYIANEAWTYVAGVFSKVGGLPL